MLFACQEDDNTSTYSIQPFIALESVEFVEGIRTLDSLIVTISYQDGDNNLGIASTDTTSVYIVLPDPDTGDKYWLYDKNDPDLPPYSCSDYQYFLVSDTVMDTVRAVFNPDFYNFSVTLWIKDSGKYQEYDFLDQCIPPLGGRFGKVNSEYSPFTLRQTSPWTGRLTFTVRDFFWLRFEGDTVKLTINVRDETFLHSNIVESDPFVFR